MVTKRLIRSPFTAVFQDISGPELAVTGECNSLFLGGSFPEHSTTNTRQTVCLQYSMWMPFSSTLLFPSAFYPVQLPLTGS